jgi:hypothetical protein
VQGRLEINAISQIEAEFLYHFHEHGFIILKDAIPHALLHRAKAALEMRTFNLNVIPFQGATLSGVGRSRAILPRRKIRIRLRHFEMRCLRLGNKVVWTDDEV